MPKTKISEFSATPGNNTDIDGINISEGCAPSGINDAIRELMAQLKDFQAGTAGDSFNGPIGTTTPAAGVFTNLSASGTFALTGDQVQISEGGTGQTTANAAFNALAPSQSTHAGKYLKTDGTNTSWDAIDINTADITGTLPVANGGTGVTSSTGTGSVVLSASPTFTGTVNGAALTLSSSLTLSGGTANGVAYLNGSKVLTTGSALVFDGFSAGTLTVGSVSGSKIQFPRFSDNAAVLQITSSSTVNELQVRNSSGGGENYLKVGNGYLAFGADTTEQMRLTSTGLGIGTSSPGQKLEVAGNIFVNAAAGNPYVEIKTAGAGNNPYLRLTASTNYWEMLSAFSQTNKDLLIRYNGTTFLDIDNTGNLGLGVTPSAWWSSTKAIQVGAGGVISGRTDTAARNYFASNAFLNSTPAWTYISTNFATRYEQNDGQHQWFTAASGTAGNTITFTQAMTLDASGNLLVGTTTALTSARAVFAGGNVRVRRADPDVVLGDNGSTLGLVGTINNYDFAFFTNGTERARITSGGAFRIATTSTLVSASEIVSVDAGSTNGLTTKTSGGAASWNYFAWNSATSGNNGFIEFGTEGTYTARGSITYNRAGGLVVYNTTSDYRAKDIIGPAQNTGATIDALKVYEGVMKGATQARPMMIAHEAQAVTPYAVTGEKDAVNADGTPKYQQMDHASLVPLLIAELQSLRARVAQLEAK